MNFNYHPLPFWFASDAMFISQDETKKSNIEYRMYYIKKT